MIIFNLLSKPLFLIINRSALEVEQPYFVGFLIVKGSKNIDHEVMTHQ